MEPISRILPTRDGLEPVRGARPLDRVEREDPRPDDDRRRRRPAPPRRPEPGVAVDDDGVVHVDVQA